MKSLLSFGLLLIILVVTLSCQNDDFTKPEIEPKAYTFNLINKLRFDFYQLSQTTENIGPYTNSLIVNNISGGDLSANFLIWSFSSTIRNYENLSFLTEASTGMLVSNDSVSITALEASDSLFSDNNLIVSVLNFNDANDHPFNGLYSGELNVYSIIDPNSELSEDNLLFVKSVPCSGSIDYQGTFHLFSQDATETNVSYLRGNFNSSNLITGDISKSDGSNLSQLVNIPGGNLMLENGNLSGYAQYLEGSDARILEFNITNQN